MNAHRFTGRALVGVALVLLAAGCTGEASPSQAPAPSPDATQATPPPTLAAATPRVAGSPEPSPRAEWPFVRASCEDLAGDPWLIVALGTSETAGWGVRSDESHSPQAAYPALYADILCRELGLPVELHSYYPSQLDDGLAPLSRWIEKVEGDAAMRADLGAAHVVVLWALSSHDIVKPLFLPGRCRGAWPDPLKECLALATADIPVETDQLFGLIAGLVRDDATVLAGDAFAPPVAISMFADEPYRDEIKAMVDPLFSVKPMAEKHGFIFIDTELAFNGPSRWEMPEHGLFQGDGLHLTAAGQLLAASTYAEQDGLSD